MRWVALVLAAVLAPVANGALTFGVKAGLDVQQQVPPPQGALTATGTLSGRLVVSGTRGKLVWNLGFRGLTGRALRVELHRGRLGHAGPTVAGLCSPCRSGAQGIVLAREPLVTAIRNGAVYVVIATRKNPAGEIRGQLRVLTGA